MKIECSRLTLITSPAGPQIRFHTWGMSKSDVMPSNEKGFTIRIWELFIIVTLWKGKPK